MKLWILAGILSCSLLSAQSPILQSWVINPGGQTGYNGYLTNVQKVSYTSTDVYISCTCIPGYDIGPWQSNPNLPVPENFVFKITRSPQVNNGTPITTPLGHTGVWTNGVSIFNAKDGMSYNNQGVWNRDAKYWEGVSFDNCLGHPAPNGEYHHHVSPTCLYDDTDSTHHSPVIGYAFDGYPIYGAYGYAQSDGSGGIKRMHSSYVMSTATTRTNGPAVSSSYPAGCFIEDFSYVAGSGDLDEHNGRFCITPEYPNGTYAYFVTIDENRKPVYPYTMGPTYYGVVPQGNTGPGGGHNTIPANATVYTPNSTAPSISIAIQGTASCENSVVHFNASSTNGGSSPSYQWYRNGTMVGTNSAMYSDSSLKNKDSVWCQLTSSDASANPKTVLSNVLHLSLQSAVVPGIAISSQSYVELCEGTTLALNCTTQHVDTQDQIRWFVNDSLVATGNSLLIASVHDGDIIHAEVQSSIPCAQPTSAQSSPVHCVVHPLPEVPVISRTQDMLQSSQALAYQWYFNGQIIVGATNQTYAISLTDGTYTVRITDANGCSRLSDGLAVGNTSEVADVTRSTFGIEPNPAAGSLRLSSTELMNEVDLSIVDELGRTVLQRHITHVDPALPVLIDIHTLLPAAYSLRIHSATSTRTVRFVKCDE